MKNIIKPGIKAFLFKIGFFVDTNEAERVKWLAETLKKIPKDNRILDAGAGELAQKKYCKHLNYVSQDFGQYDGKGDTSGLQKKEWDNTKLDIVSDITDIPEPDNSFDAIMCIEVFEHIPDPVSAIKEFSRLLKKEGALIITAPFCSLTHFAPYHFYSGFNRYFYEKYLPENDFEIIELKPNGGYFDYIRYELNRIQSCAERYTQKKLSFFAKLVLKAAIITLTRVSRRDKNSHELLTSGYHVFAKKIN